MIDKHEDNMSEQTEEIEVNQHPESLDVMEHLVSALDALFFVSDRILTVPELEVVLTEFSRTQIIAAIENLQKNKAASGSGIELAQVRKGYQYRTKALNKSWIIAFQKAKPQRLSRAALESLSIIAYRQPITRPEVDEIRGVDSSGVIRMLMERGLVRILGKRDEAGHPLLYGTSKEFLSFFQLNDLAELPPLKEYTELGEDSLKKLQTLFPDSEPEKIQDRMESENIIPVDAATSEQPSNTPPPSS